MLHWEELLTFYERSPLIFSQYTFLFVFTIFFAFYLAVFKNITVRNIYLLAFSLFFYYKSGGLYFWMLIFSTFVDYHLANYIFKATTTGRKKLFLVLSLSVNLGLLAFFKYSYFVTDSLNTLLGTDFIAYNFLTGISNVLAGTSYDVTEIILPVGISFYTFQAMSYTLDIYRGHLQPVKNIWDFGFFISFFPHLVAGPIVRAADFIPQVYKPYNVTKEEMGAAVFLIMKGLIKKVLISDYISINLVDRVFDTPQLYSGVENLLAIYGYTLQIYCDFSGYSDMAIGLALLMGFRLGINFNSPYKAANITDFWRRWHISLSSWLRDYLYVSLGGNRKGKWRTKVNLLLTMLIGGLWHGASVKFILWGALHGAALVADKAWTNFSAPFINQKSFVYRALVWLITFNFVAFCWIYFRAADMETVRLMLFQVVNDMSLSAIGERMWAYKHIVSLLILGFGIHWLPDEWKQNWQNMFIRTALPVKAFIIAVVIALLYQVASSEVQPFIYFQF
ncbi:MAG: MBOAT family O-acyltransferase [Bacteroidia bacterium]